VKFGTKPCQATPADSGTAIKACRLRGALHPLAPRNKTMGMTRGSFALFGKRLRQLSQVPRMSHNVERCGGVSRPQTPLSVISRVRSRARARARSRARKSLRTALRLQQRP
jgi:hypothetical protein